MHLYTNEYVECDSFEGLFPRTPVQQKEQNEVNDASLKFWLDASRKVA